MLVRHLMGCYWQENVCVNDSFHSHAFRTSFRAAGDVNFNMDHSITF